MRRARSQVVSADEPQVHFSQGALRVKRHRHYGTPTHHTWRKMRERCNNRRASQWRWYGARGIRVCERWNDPNFGFVRFLEDMGERPSGMTLDRINQNGHYEPSNCRWATQTQQVWAQKKTVLVELDGERVSLSEAARRVGIKAGTIYQRLKSGKTMAEALTTGDLRASPCPRYRSLTYRRAA